ncbi:MAG: hypothetical protein R3F13_06385 [Prosthecobacter sp.]
MIVLVVVLGGVFVILIGRRLDLSFINKDSSIEIARRSIESKDWSTALDAIQKVPSDSRQKVAYMRVLADYLQGSRTSPQVLSRVIASLEAEGALQPADFIWICREHLLAGRISEAQEAWNRLPVELRQTLAGRELELTLLGHQGRREAALRAEQEMFDLFPDEPTIILRKAVRDLDGTLTEVHDAAWSQLWEVATHKDTNGQQAIRLLAKRKELSMPEAGRLLELCDQGPSANTQDRLLVLESLYRLSSEDGRKQLLDQEIGKNKIREKGAALAFAAWLAKIGEIDRMRDFCSANAAINTGESYLLLAQSLAEGKNWSALMELTSRGGRQVPVPPSRVATWRALAFRNLHTDDITGIREHLTAAIRVADEGKDELAMMGAARMAEEWSHPDLALRAYLLLSEFDRKREVEILEKAWDTAATLKDASALLAISERQTHLKPDVLKYMLHWRYIALLSKKEPLPPSTSSSAFEHSPQGLLVLALEAHVAQKPEAVATILQKISQPWTLPPGQRAVYAGLLSQSPDRVGEAHAIAEKIFPTLLLPDEHTFLKMAL